MNHTALFPFPKKFKTSKSNLIGAVKWKDQKRRENKESNALNKSHGNSPIYANTRGFKNGFF